jgi:hypothetical protein
MAYTLNQTILWSQSILGSYIPLTAQTGNEPATTIGNMVVVFVNSPPFTWATNRAEDTSLTTVAGQSDYQLSIANFGFLEKLSLIDGGGKYWDVPRIYNTTAINKNTDQTKRPDAVSVSLINPGTSVTLRFPSMDAIYTSCITTYQKAPVLFSATSQDWFTQCNLPQSQMHIYNNLFLGEAFQTNGDEQSAAIYRRRGMAALLATAEGLTEMQKSMIFAQAMFSDLQTIAANLRTQAAAQARTI